MTEDGETVQSLLVFLVEEALEASVEDAADIGKFCLRITRLLLAHGVEPHHCQQELEPSLLHTTLELFDHFFPLALLLVQSGASMVCPRHGPSCWSGHALIFQRLQTALQSCPDPSRAADLLDRAEALLDLARVNRPGLCAPPRLDLPEPAQDSHPYAQALRDFHGRAAACRAAPPALQCLCRALIRSCLESRSLEDGVQALPLPDRLKDFVLAGRSYVPKPGWDCFKPQHSRR